MNDILRLARLRVRLMSISNDGLTVQNGPESLLVRKFKEKLDSDTIFLKLKNAVEG